MTHPSEFLPDGPFNGEQVRDSLTAEAYELSEKLELANAGKSGKSGKKGSGKGPTRKGDRQPSSSGGGRFKPKPQDKNK